MTKFPEKRITSYEALLAVLGSDEFRKFYQFIESLADSVKKTPARVILDPENPVIIQKLVTLFDDLTKLTDNYPPLEQSFRFGNIAFRDWYTAADKVISTSNSDILHSCSAFPDDQLFVTHFTLTQEIQLYKDELTVYLMNSFGDHKRLDYGTGHELNFFVYLYSLFCLKLISKNEARASVLLVFARYLKLVRHLQKVYQLEPAGSRGVWGLDDYQFLPFLFGAAQLTDDLIPPDKIATKSVVYEYANDYMYFDCIKHIMESKKNVPFGECAPLLNDISAVGSWSQIYKGMVKMFYAEVLSKFPIMQHFFLVVLYPTISIDSKNSSMSNKIPIYYYVTDDNDDINHPNLFYVTLNNKVGSLRLNHIYEQFPLPGNYHFRFKVIHKNSFCWLDIKSPDAEIPYFDNIVVRLVDFRNSPNTFSIRQSSNSEPSDLLLLDSPRRQIPNIDSDKIKNQNNNLYNFF